MDILQSSSREEYQQKLENYNKEWPDKFKKYYATFLDRHVRVCYRPELERLGIYNKVSGITNNAAESANAAFKTSIKKQKMGLFQAVYAWFFYQNDYITDIVRGIEGFGNYKMNFKSVPGGVFIPQVKDERMGLKLGIAVVTRENLPPILETNGDYKSPSLPDTLLQRNLAKLFVSEGRVDNFGKRGIWIVEGLLKKIYTVIQWYKEFNL